MVGQWQVRQKGFVVLFGMIIKSLATKIQVYADSEEQQAMEICHPRCIELLQNFADKIVHHGRIRALDVAGGDGRITKDLILASYDRGDLID